MPSFKVSPDDIRDVCTKRLGPAAQGVQAAAGTIGPPTSVHAREVWQEVPGMISGAVTETAAAVSTIAADIARFQSRTQQAADTYQAMEESNQQAAQNVATER